MSSWLVDVRDALDHRCFASGQGGGPDPEAEELEEVATPRARFAERRITQDLVNGQFLWELVLTALDRFGLLMQFPEIHPISLVVRHSARNVLS